MFKTIFTIVLMIGFMVLAIKLTIGLVNDIKERKKKKNSNTSASATESEENKIIGDNLNDSNSNND